MSRTDDFLAAKQIIRLHPERTDEQVAEEIGAKVADPAALNTIRQARKDVDAGDVANPTQ